MKSLTFISAAAFLAGSAMTASAQRDGGIDFTDRDPENEYFVCHVEGHVNDRFVFNQKDADFCTDVIGGEVVLLPAPDAAYYMSQSKIRCYQRNPVCLFDPN